MILATRAEVAAKVKRLEHRFNDLGYDRFGVSREHVRKVITLFAYAYRHYFRVHVHGIDNVPPRGRAMLIGNHQGGVALDAAMVLTSLILEPETPRLAHSMVEKFIGHVPFASAYSQRIGQLAGLPEHAARLLEDERLVMVFPEGARGTAKLYSERRELVGFGTGFMRLALTTRSPIVPFAFLGGGEAIPTVYNAYRLGRRLGVPYVPITPYLAPIPLPVRLDILYGAPMSFDGDGSADDAVVAAHVELVRARILELIQRGERARRRDITHAELGATLRRSGPSEGER